MSRTALPSHPHPGRRGRQNAAQLTLVEPEMPGVQRDREARSATWRSSMLLMFQRW